MLGAFVTKIDAERSAIGTAKPLAPSRAHRPGPAAVTSTPSPEK